MRFICSEWVNCVVEEIIFKDLVEVKKEFYEKYYELKEERMNLIKSKVKDKFGVELEVCSMCRLNGLCLNFFQCNR